MAFCEFDRVRSLRSIHFLPAVGGTGQTLKGVRVSVGLEVPRGPLRLHQNGRNEASGTAHAPLSPYPPDGYGDSGACAVPLLVLLRPWLFFRHSAGRIATALEVLRVSFARLYTCLLYTSDAADE